MEVPADQPAEAVAAVPWYSANNYHGTSPRYVSSRQRFSRGDSASTTRLTACGAGSPDLGMLPVYKWIRPSHPEKTCSVCHGEYIPGDKLRLLPCFHEFHRDCIDQWLQGSVSCPCCRACINDALRKADELLTVTSPQQHSEVGERRTGDSGWVSNFTHWSLAVKAAALHICQQCMPGP